MPPHDFHYTAETIAELADKYIDRNRKTEDKVAKLKPEDCTFDSVLLALSRDEEGFESAINPAIFMQSVSTDKAVRDAATEASKKISVCRFS
jgi:Zn-dependent oligopeptidase